jgi:hypothetical protein
MRKDISWLDKRALARNKNKLSRILEHERGHLQIAYIVANQLQQRKTKIYSSNNYRNDAKIIADRTFNEFSGFEDLYDRETNHSNNHAKQLEWNKKLITLLR